jgi:hypothetical protein
MSPISYPKDSGHNPFNGRVYLCFSIGLKYGLLSHQADDDVQKLCTIVFPWQMKKKQIQARNHGYQDCLDPDVFQNVMSKLVQDMEFVKTTILS